MASKSERFELRIDEEQLLKVDQWAKDQEDQPTRAEAIRRLVSLGLSTGSSSAVRFSDGEKILILMMKDVLKSVKAKDTDIDPDFLSDVIYGGHYWAPKWEMQGVFHNHIDTPQDVSHVLDVLDMWDFIELSYKELTPDQKAAIVTEVGPWAKKVEFPGFDGNNESEQMSIADFLINKMNRFSRFKKRDLNSHYETSERYQNMLAAFKPIRKKLGGRLMNVQELTAVLWEVA